MMIIRYYHTLNCWIITMQHVRKLFIAFCIISSSNNFSLNIGIACAEFCEPDYAESPSFSQFLASVENYSSTKWTFSSPTRRELANEVKFWCIEPYNKYLTNYISCNKINNIRIIPEINHNSAKYTLNKCQI